LVVQGLLTTEIGGNVVADSGSTITLDPTSGGGWNYGTIKAVDGGQLIANIPGDT
jgi:hypothetical protein